MRKALRGFLPFGCVLAVASGALWLATWLAPACSVGPLVAYALAFFAVSAELLAAAYWVPRMSMGHAAALCALSTVLLYAVHGQTATPLSALTVTLALLVGSSALGGLIGARIEQPGHLVAVFAISALADLWSVYDASGPSAKLALAAASHPDRLVLFALPWPMFGGQHIRAVIGAGDILFAALYTATLRRHGLRTGTATLAMGIGLTAGLALLLMWGRALPLLPLMGAGVMWAEPRARSLPVEDRRSVAVVVVLLAAVLVYRLTR